MKKTQKYLRIKLDPNLLSRKTCNGKTDWSTVYNIIYIRKMLRYVKKYTSQIMENTKNSLKGATLLEKIIRDE